MSPPDSRSPIRGLAVAIALGLVGGLLLVGLSLREARFGGRSDARIEILVNGLDARTSRDVLLPSAGWVLQVALPPALPAAIRDSLSVTLRAERTGATIEIADQLVQRGDTAVLEIPESLGLFPGLLSIRATLTDGGAHELSAQRRVRIRAYLGGPPIGSRQIVHFDFTVDRDADGRPDFERDLERFGLATSERPELARRVAARVAERARSRVERAYSAPDDPNGTGRDHDPVFVRFLLEAEPGPVVTRICVGGSNRAHPKSVGNVRFDLRNERRSTQECEGKESAGLFPAELVVYRGSALYDEVLGPFAEDRGGVPVGRLAGDEARIEALEDDAATADRGDERADERGRAIARAIAVLGDALGTVMAHESAHALGLVPPGRPGVGLFGGSEDEGEAYAHNLDVDPGREGARPAARWLMDVGTRFTFEELAGQGPAGELRFRPLNYAYLRDRLVIIDGRKSP